MYVLSPPPTVANVARSFLELHFIYAILNDLEIEIISQDATPLETIFPRKYPYVNNPG